MSKLVREVLSALNGVLPKSVTFNNYGRKWRIPNIPKSMERLMRPGREALTGDWVKKFVPTCDIVIDIGANVGQSLLLYKSLYPDAKYIGLEPNPICSSVVCRLIAINDLKDCRVFTAGIGPSLSIAELLVNNRRPDDPSATLVPDCHPGAASRLALPVITLPLQELIPDLELSSRSVIKIDVEGYEADVLDSLGDLADQRPVIVSEVLTEWRGNASARGVSIRRLQSWLEKNRYAIVAVGQGVVDRIVDECETYLFVPSEHDGLH